MRSHRILGLSLLLTLLSSTVLTWFIAPASASVLHVPSAYPTIQSAVDVASPGDIIQVAAGTYNESVVVTCRQITIVGEDPMTTIVDAEGKDTVFNIREDDVEICNLTIRNGGPNYNGIIVFYPYVGAVIRNNRIMHNRLGIVLSESDDNTIEGNVLLDNSMYGVTARDFSDNIIIKNNTISESAYGIELSDASLSQVVNNRISDTSYGVYVANSNDNNVSANTLTNNSWNLYLTRSNSNVVEDNSVSGGSLGIEIMRSQGNSVFNNTVSVDSYGIYLGYCGANTVSGNSASLSDWGIELYNSAGSTIKENTVSENTWGIYIAEDSDGNRIYHNNLIQNAKQAYQDPASSNIWRTSTTPYQGNHWSDYIGADDGSGGRTAGDGIGDTYLPWQGLDNYPLMAEWGGIHDVAIEDVTPSATSVYWGEIVRIDVEVKNEGTWTETFDVTVRYNSTVIGVQTVNNLAPSTDTTLTFEWNTTEVDPGNYIIKAEATIVVFEVDIADNTCTDGTVTVMKVHDAAITSMDVYPRAVPVGQLIYIEVTVENRGNFTETFDVIVYADQWGTDAHFDIGNETVSLEVGDSTLLEFVWNTTSVPYGTYWVTAEAVLPEDYAPTDNVARVQVGGITVPFRESEPNVFALCAPLAAAILAIVALGGVAIVFFKLLMAIALRWSFIKLAHLLSRLQRPRTLRKRHTCLGKSRLGLETMAWPFNAVCRSSFSSWILL